MRDLWLESENYLQFNQKIKLCPHSLKYQKHSFVLWLNFKINTPQFLFSKLAQQTCYKNMHKALELSSLLVSI